MGIISAVKSRVESVFKKSNPSSSYPLPPVPTIQYTSPIGPTQSGTGVLTSSKINYGGGGSQGYVGGSGGGSSSSPSNVSRPSSSPTTTIGNLKTSLPATKSSPSTKTTPTTTPKKFASLERPPTNYERLTSLRKEDNKKFSDRVKGFVSDVPTGLRSGLASLAGAGSSQGPDVFQAGRDFSSPFKNFDFGGKRGNVKFNRIDSIGQRGSINTLAPSTKTTSFDILGIESIAQPNRLRGKQEIAVIGAEKLNKELQAKFNKELDITRSGLQSGVSSGAITQARAQGLFAEKQNLLNKELGTEFNTRFAKEVMPSTSMAFDTNLLKQKYNVGKGAELGLVGGSLFLPSTASNALFGTALLSDSIRSGIKVKQQDTLGGKIKYGSLASAELGLGLVGTRGTFTSIGKSYERSALENLGKNIKLTRGERYDFGKAGIDVFKSSAKNDFGFINVEGIVPYRKKGKSLIFDKGKARASVVYDDILGNQKTITRDFLLSGKTQRTNMKGFLDLNKGFEGFGGFAGRTTFKPISEITTTIEGKRLFGSKIGQGKMGAVNEPSQTQTFLGIGKQKKVTKDIFKGDDFSTITRDFLVSFSGKPKGAVFEPTTKQAGAFFNPENVAVSRLRKFNVKSTSSDVKFITGSGRKSSQTFIQTLRQQPFPALDTTQTSKSLARSLTSSPTLKTSPTPSFASPTLIPQKKQSAFYGLGLYERTSNTGAFAIQSPLTRTKSSLGLGSASLLRTIESQKNILGVSNIQKSRLNTTQRQGQLQRQTLKLKQTPITKNPFGSTGLGDFNYKPTFPIRTRIGFGGFPVGFDLRSFGRRSSRFNMFGLPKRQPSLVAIGQNIRSTKRGRAEFSSLTIRPLIISPRRSRTRRLSNVRRKRKRPFPF